METIIIIYALVGVIFDIIVDMYLLFKGYKKSLEKIAGVLNTPQKVLALTIAAVLYPVYIAIWPITVTSGLVMTLKSTPESIC